MGAILAKFRVRQHIYMQVTFVGPANEIQIYLYTERKFYVHLYFLCLTYVPIYL